MGIEDLLITYTNEMCMSYQIIHDYETGRVLELPNVFTSKAPESCQGVQRLCVSIINMMHINHCIKRLTWNVQAVAAKSGGSSASASMRA